LRIAAGKSNWVGDKSAAPFSKTGPSWLQTEEHALAERTVKEADAEKGQPQADSAEHRISAFGASSA